LFFIAGTKMGSTFAPKIKRIFTTPALGYLKILLFFDNFTINIYFI